MHFFLDARHDLCVTKQNIEKKSHSIWPHFRFLYLVVHAAPGRTSVYACAQIYLAGAPARAMFFPGAIARITRGETLVVRVPAGDNTSDPASLGRK